MIGFRPAEALSVIDFDDMLYAAAGKRTDADPSTSDVSVDLAR